MRFASRNRFLLCQYDQPVSVEFKFKYKVRKITNEIKTLRQQLYQEKKKGENSIFICFLRILCEQTKYIRLLFKEISTLEKKERKFHKLCQMRTFFRIFFFFTFFFRHFKHQFLLEMYGNTHVSKNKQLLLLLLS